MKILISPAKSLDFESPIPTARGTQPAFPNITEKLNKKLSRLSKKELGRLMHISDKLAELNHTRYQEFQVTHHKGNSRPAVYAFNGDVYTGLDAYRLPNEKLDRLQDTLRILSGMYGILRPLDLVQPYRLEMGTAIGINRKKDLYELWQERVTDYLNNELGQDELLLNLASKEYFKAVDTKHLKVPVITPVFKDFKNGKLKILSFFAKKARGAMVRYIMDHEVKTLDGIKGFDYMDYRFSPDHTRKEQEPVFTR